LWLNVLRFSKYFSEKSSQKKFLDTLRDGKLTDRFRRAIQGLAENPRPPGCLKMQGNEELYRIRVGYLYQVRDTVLLVLVVSIGNRREIYR